MRSFALVSKWRGYSTLPVTRVQMTSAHVYCFGCGPKAPGLGLPRRIFW